jgi:hypothetical protein
MALEESFLTRAIDDFRRYTDEPSINAKYTDAVIADMLMQSYATVVGEINRNSRQMAVARYTITYLGDSTQRDYVLPPIMGSVHCIYKEDSNTGARTFYYARGRRSPIGRGIWIEGNILKVQQQVLTVDEELVIEYIPAKTAKLHNGTFTVDSTGKIVTLDSTPSAGSLDTNLNAYAGMIFRVLDSDDSGYEYVQEQPITSYDRTNYQATLPVALNPNHNGQAGPHYYEIAPPIHNGLDHVVSLYLARWILLIEGDPRADSIERLYRDAIRTVRLDAYYSNLDDAAKMESDNYQRHRFRRGRVRT